MGQSVSQTSSAPVGSAGRSGSQSFLVIICAVAALGGLLFGFDTAVISGAVGMFRDEFHLSAVMTGWAAGSAIIGCMIGAAIAGILADRFGRRRVLLLSGLFFAVSATGCGLVHTVDQLVWFRILGGIGIGISSITSPMYIAEVAPAAMRGRLVSFQQLAIVSGILVAFFSNSLIVRTTMADPVKWRWMFALGAFPAVIFLLLTFFIPESPRWLVKRGSSATALETLAKISGRTEAEAEMARITAAIEPEGGSIAAMFRPGMFRALVVATMLAIFSQITGINAIMYYAPEVFKQAGAGASAAFSCAVWVGVVNFVTTIVAMNTVDRVGRKPLLLGGTLFLCLSLGLVGYGFHTHSGGLWVLIAVLCYVGGFAISLGPVSWIVMAEFFPTSIRGRAMSVATVALWAACYVVSQTFPILLEKLGSAWTFWSYGLVAAVTFAFIAIFVPETKGRTLEEIERDWLRLGDA